MLGPEFRSTFLELLAKDADVAVDSYPIAGAGQVLDTYNLLGDATGRALRRLAKAMGKTVEEVAAELDASAFTARSVKGRFDVDWSDPKSRRRFLVEFVAAATRVQGAIRGFVKASTTEASLPEGEDASVGEPTSATASTAASTVSTAASPEAATELGDDDTDGGGMPGLTPPSGAVPAASSDSDHTTQALLGDVELLDHIIERDVARDDEGQIEGIVQRTGGGRTISITDTDMRHGRKSASVSIAGFKANIVVSVAFGWILLTKVFGADEHDGADLPALTEALSARRGLHPRTMSGDHAYGTLTNHAHFARRMADGGPELIAPSLRIGVASHKWRSAHQGPV